MTEGEEDKTEEPQKHEEKKSNISKEKILDESFKKAELLKKGPTIKKEEPVIAKKPIMKIGLVITFIAIIGLLFINFLPLMYIYYETDLGSIEEYFSYNDIRFDLIEPEEINNIFESSCNNCSHNSDYYFGVTKNDLINSPRITIYIFIILALIGIIFTIYILIDRKKDFSDETNTIVQSFFIVFLMILSIYLLSINLKFLDSHLFFELNKPFIFAMGFNRLRIFFLMPYFSILISFVLFCIGLVFMKIYLNRAVNQFNVKKSKRSEVSYRFGSNI
ncbi:MAG: hypothetical protein AYK22_03570 [Thermoplasmatales archaeon SG8-52-3]|nr:MAG: hypothetical protein AYK22_03570 [Thermoplasmatales archaeon SG8-52-3]